MTLNRLTGLFVILAGLVFYFWITPAQTETADIGWLKPNTLPNAVTVMIIILGLIHFIIPSGEAKLDRRLSLRIALFMGLTAASLYLMSLVGFLIAAPLMMAVFMLMVGERRPLWLIAGIVLMPASIWLAVDVLLGRPLP